MSTAPPVLARTGLTPAEDAVARRVFRRIGPFVVVLFIASYLDRINLGYAALSMNRDLGLSATQYGLAITVFYATYILAEIPSNMLMARFGARLWVSRIMVSWGLASAAQALAVGPASLLTLRGLLGLAEAGFMPSILFYLTLWFPAAYQARATSLFIMAQPVTMLFGAPLSGALLELDGVSGLAGWRWLLLAEGLPAVVLGVAAFLFLTDRPEGAHWLLPEEKRNLRSALDREDGREGAIPAGVRGLLSAPVVLLAVTYVGMVVSLGANSTWVPQIVREMLPGRSFWVVGVFTALPALVTIVVMPLWSRHSDRRGERTWHVALPMLAAAAGWCLVALSASPPLRYAGLVLVAAGAFSAQGIFWTLPARFLPRGTRPVGIALVNSFGNLGVLIGPFVIGALHDATGSFTAGLLFVAVSVTLGAACVVAAGRLGRFRAD